jgi:hypothetical protein
MARISDAAEFLAVSVIAALGSYLLAASQSIAEATFFGIAGAFVSLLALGLIRSPLRRHELDGEAWAGRYLLNSTAGLLFFVVLNAGTSALGT